MNREERINHLRRKEDRNKRLPRLLDGLSTVTGNPIPENKVLTIEEIDEFQAHVNAADFEFNFLNTSFAKSEAKELSGLLLELKDELSQENY